MAKSRSMCSGCRDDYYNRNREGGCWCFATATVVTRTSVGTWQPPPYKWMPQKTLSCHHPEGLHWIGKDDCRLVHNWKAAAAAGGGDE